MPRAAGEQQTVGWYKKSEMGRPVEAMGVRRSWVSDTWSLIFSQSRFWNQSWLGSAPRGAESPVLCSRRREGPKLLGSPKITGRWLWFSRDEPLQDYGAVVEGN